MPKYADLLQQQVEGIGRKPSVPLDLSSLLMAMMFMQGDKNPGAKNITPNQEEMVGATARDIVEAVRGPGQQKAAPVPPVQAEGETSTYRPSFWEFLNQQGNKPPLESIPTPNAPQIPGPALGATGMPDITQDPQQLMAILKLLGVL